MGVPPAEQMGGEFRRMVGNYKISYVRRITRILNCFQSNCEAMNGNTKYHDGRKPRFGCEGRRRARKICEFVMKFRVGALEGVFG